MRCAEKASIIFRKFERHKYRGAADAETGAAQAVFFLLAGYVFCEETPLDAKMYPLVPNACNLTKFVVF